MLKLPSYTIAGIDYGSKLAGTTVLAVLQHGKIDLFSSEKGKDADLFLQELLLALQPKIVAIDAPLSLPGVYNRLEGYHNYFFREADRQLRAMSPMFLGGLTARAMQLRSKLESAKMQFIETYPSGWVKFFATEAAGYRSKVEAPYTFCSKSVEIISLLRYPDVLASWHYADALIALQSCLRYENQQHIMFGNPEEGEIVI